MSGATQAVAALCADVCSVRPAEAQAAFEVAAGLAGNNRERELLKRRALAAADQAAT
jgi:hypothetical protein